MNDKTIKIINILNNFDAFLTSSTRPATDTNIAIYEHWLDCRNDIEKTLKEEQK